VSLPALDLVGAQEPAAGVQGIATSGVVLMFTWCFLSHDWDRWKDIDTGLIQNVAVVAGIERPDLPRTTVGKFIRQERRCNDCNAAELRKTVA
jgi:hypothetical protein